jgi:hypothetical protein
MLASLSALALTACGGANSAGTKHRSSGSSVAAIARGSVRHVRPFPRLPPGAPCPRTPGGHATHTTIITLDHGPVYPILGFAIAPPAAGGVVDYQGEGRSGRHPDGWGNKVLFFVVPMTGTFSVQGRQVDGPRSIDWLIENGQLVGKLELPEGGHWYATEALLKGAGCYALRIEGSSFSSLIVFKAVSDRAFRASFAR